MGVLHLAGLAITLAVGVVLGLVIVLAALAHVIGGGVAVVSPVRDVQALELAYVARELL